MRQTTTKVLVLYTGGTIGAVPEDPANPGSPLRPAGKERLATFVANPLDGIAWDLQGLTDATGQAVGPLDSSSVGPQHWCWMAAAIIRAYDDYDGFVVLHGTDTMAYTASALSFLLQDLAKPVVLTGAQLPIFRPRTDAIVNLTNALTIAGWQASGLPLVPEVTICFADRLLRGNRTTKVSTLRWAGFDSPNYPHLGRIGERIAIDSRLLQQLPIRSETASMAAKGLDPDVVAISLHPGMRAEQIAALLSLPTVKGCVLRCFGAGNAPEDVSFLAAIATAVASGRLVAAVSQCQEGKVEMGLYAASSGLQAAGVVSGADMTVEAALTKMMWLLANVPGPDCVARFQSNQRGEQSE